MQGSRFSCLARLQELHIEADNISSDGSDTADERIDVHMGGLPSELQTLKVPRASLLHNVCRRNQPAAGGVCLLSVVNEVCLLT